MTNTLTTAQISTWEATGEAAKQIAAQLARKILSGRLPAYAGLPSNESLARQWDTSERTAIRAKELLAGYGLLRKENGTYYVTSPPPAATPPPAGKQRQDRDRDRQRPAPATPDTADDHL